MLSPNVPHSSADPRITVENRLEPGRYRVRLVVLDEARNASAPSDLIVEVKQRVITPVDPDIRVRPDIFTRPEILTRPIDPGIFRPVRPRRPGG